MSVPRNLRKPTPKRVAAYWKDLIQAWGTIGRVAAVELESELDPEDN